MALSQSTQFGIATASFGVLSFLIGIFAELKKPPLGTLIKGRDVAIWQFLPDLTVVLGALSMHTAACYAGIGALPVFFPYNDKSIPRKALFD